MTKTIRDVFDLPRAEDIRAMGFVVRLNDSLLNPEQQRKLVDDYVITPTVQRELPRILSSMKQVWTRGEEYGRFIHGSFGSGKSHFLTMLSLLLEGSDAAWDKFRPVFEPAAATLGSGAEYQTWTQTANLLVVRAHMLTTRGKTTGLDWTVYTALNDTLKARGKEPFGYVNAEAILDEVRAEAKAYGAALWRRLADAGIIEDEKTFEAMAKDSALGREAFAKGWLKLKGRDIATSGTDLPWSQGLNRMAEHVKALGYSGIVFVLDEFLLWLAEKSGQEFVREINNLNVMVDHTTGQRALPLFVLIARQRNLKEFFPDLISEDKIHEHLNHHSKRFEETRLEDVELRHIVAGRVLRPLDKEAVRQVTDSLAQRHAKALPTLLAHADLDYLRDVYPFHPALIEMLVDVTSLMQRERSALRLLYELLVVFYPELPLGELLPVGAAFEALFPESGVEAQKKVDQMQDIHRQYYTRLRPAMRELAKSGVLGPIGEREKALDQMIKTVLLGEVSPRLKGNGLTIERLVLLNAVDIEGEQLRGMVNVARADLLALSQQVPDLQVVGEGKTALVTYVLDKVGFAEVLGRAKSKVDNETRRFSELWRAFKKELGVEGLKGFGEGEKNDGEVTIKWRNTERKGRLKFGNVRELTDEDFVPPDGGFTVLVDYPWDAPGYTVDEDRNRANKVRQTKGTLYTLCWLPRHLSPLERELLTNLAAARYVVSTVGQEDLLTSHGPADRVRIVEQASTRMKQLEGELVKLLQMIYLQQSEWVALVSDVDRRPVAEDSLKGNLEFAAKMLLDRKFPQHPRFLAEPKKGELELLLAWMVQAGESNVSVAYDGTTERVLKTLGQPLDVVNLGQSKASLRLDTQYIKTVLQETDKESVAWAPIEEKLRNTFGFLPMVSRLFLAFVCQRTHRALREVTLEPIEVKLDMPTVAGVRLQRGKLLGVTEWSQVRELGQALFGVPMPAVHRSLQEQDRFAVALKKAGIEKRKVLQEVHTQLVQLGVGDGARLVEIGEANERLAGLAAKNPDSMDVLQQLLLAWPAELVESLGKTVKRVEEFQGALEQIDRQTLDHLNKAVAHGTAGDGVKEWLNQLGEGLTASDRKVTVTKKWIADWNQGAQRWLGELIRRPVVQAVPVVQAPVAAAVQAVVVVPTAAKSGVRERVWSRKVNVADHAEVEQFLMAFRDEINGLGGGDIQVDVVFRKEEP
ncbi:MAG: hypothetical protein HUU55_14505 [Myxococcales bacterium]|nr:hypothetical protein [Myxococcales bacterium]